MAVIVREGFVGPQGVVSPEDRARVDAAIDASQNLGAALAGADEARTEAERLATLAQEAAARAAQDAAGAVADREAVAADRTAAEAAAASLTKASMLYETWTGLSVVSGAVANIQARVAETDKGTHLDPVTAQVVPNAGKYTWSSGGKWQRQADTELTVLASDVAMRGVLVQDFGAKGDDATDDTAAFNAAIASGKTVLVPGGRTYLIAGEMLDTGMARMFGVGQPLLRCTRSQGYYRATGSGSRWRDFAFQTNQVSNGYQGYLEGTAIGNIYEDFTFYEANSGWRIQGAFNKFRNFMWRNARGQCIRLQDATCHDNEFDGLTCENGNQGVILAEAYSYNNKARGLRKYINRGTINPYLAGLINESGQLGADLFASVIESYGNSVTDFWGSDFKEGGITFSGDRNTASDGSVENTGGSAVNAGGSSNKIDRVRAKRCKNGFSSIGQAGGIAQPNTFSMCRSDDAVEIGFRGADGAYRRWTAGVQADTAPTAYCYFGQNIYQTTSPSPTRVTEFGTTPPVHTSGAVSDGLVTWQFVRSFEGRLTSDMVLIGCEAKGSGIADFFTETGEMVLIGCPGFDPVFRLPHSRGITSNALPDLTIKPQRVAPPLVNADFGYWSGADEQAIGTVALKLDGWTAARASGAGKVRRVPGLRTPFAMQITRDEGDMATGDVRFFGVITGDELKALLGRPVAIGFRAAALAGLTATNWQIAVHVYSSASTAPVPASGVPTGSTTVFSQTFQLTDTNLPYSTTVPINAVVVPPDAQILVVRWSFAPKGTGPAGDGFLLEAPTITPGTVTQEFVPEAVSVTRRRLGIAETATPATITGLDVGPQIGRSGSLHMPDTMIPASTTIAVSDTQRRFFPVSLDKLAATELRCEVTTAAAGVSARMALYAHDASIGGPGSLLVDGGEQSCASAGVLTFPINAQVPVGYAWIMLQVSGAVTLRNSGTGRQVLGTTSLSGIIKGLTDSSASYGVPPAAALSTLTLGGTGPAVAILGTR